MNVLLLMISMKERYTKDVTVSYVAGLINYVYDNRIHLYCVNTSYPSRLLSFVNDFFLGRELSSTA